MKSFGTHLQEQVDEKKYKLVILSHDDPHDPNETWILIRDKAQALGLTVLLAEFVEIQIFFQKHFFAKLGGLLLNIL